MLTVNEEMLQVWAWSEDNGFTLSCTPLVKKIHFKWCNPGADRYGTFSEFWNKEIEYPQCKYNQYKKAWCFQFITAADITAWLLGANVGLKFMQEKQYENED